MKTIFKVTGISLILAVMIYASLGIANHIYVSNAHSFIKQNCELLANEQGQKWYECDDPSGNSVEKW